MSYSRINFEDKPSTRTPISAENLNKMDEGIFNAHEQLGKIPEWSKEKEKPNYTADEVGAYSKEEINVSRATSIISTATGKTILTTDSANAPLVNLVPKGDSWQRQYEGNQLLDVEQFKNPSNWILGSVYYYQPLNLPVGTYTLSLAKNNMWKGNQTAVNTQTAFYIGTNAGTYEGNELIGNFGAELEQIRDTYTFTVQEGDVWYASIFTNGHAPTEEDLRIVFDELFVDTMLNDGTEPKPFEPFTGNAPSPSMEYSQPIVSTGQRLLSGSQMFDISKLTTTESNVDNTGYITEIGDNYIVVTTTNKHTGNGYCNTGKKLHEICPDLVIGKTYTLTAKSESTDKWFYVAGTVWEFGKAITVTEDMLNNNLVIYGYNFANYQQYGSCKISDITIVQGTVGGTWEPYTGGVEKVIDVGVEVKVFGKNQLDESDVITSAGGYRYCTNNEKLFKGGQTYTLKAHGCSVVPTGIYIYVNDVDVFGEYNKDTLTFTFDEDTHGHVRVYWANDSDIPTLEELGVQLEFGDVATEYKPYKAEQTLTIPYVLRKGDKVEYASGERLQDTTIMNLSELEWIKGNPNNNGDGTIFYTKRYDFQKYDCLCTHYRNKNVAGWENMGVGEIMHNEYIVLCTSHSTLEEFTSWLETENVQMLTKLADPIITDLTESDLQAYRQLHMNYPNTTVISDAELEVEYVADTKIYTDTLVGEAKKYKTLVDVTLDDSNSGVTSIMIELPDEFMSVSEFVTHIEIPSYENLGSVYMNGWIADVDIAYYSQCILYNNGAMTTGTGENMKFTSISRFILGGEKIFSLSSKGTSYFGANSGIVDVRSIIDDSHKERWYVKKPYLRISSDIALPTGTRITMEGR